MVKCDRCRHHHMSCDFKQSKVNHICLKEKVDFSTIEDIKAFEIECEDYDSKYIEYPLTINGIEMPKNEGIRKDWEYETGSLVKVRPCNEKYGNKTYLGILLGEADIGTIAAFNRETKILSIMRHYNPAIFVPELKEIIYGCGSWWEVIENEEELKEISDDDIDNV